MKYDEKFTFQEVTQRVSNGMGGYTEIKSDGQSFMAHKIPVKSEIMLKEYGLVTTSAFRLITKDNLPNPLESYIVKSGQTLYKVLQTIDYKLNILLVEVIVNGN